MLVDFNYIASLLPLSKSDKFLFGTYKLNGVTLTMVPVVYDNPNGFTEHIYLIGKVAKYICRLIGSKLCNRTDRIKMNIVKGVRFIKDVDYEWINAADIFIRNYEVKYGKHNRDLLATSTDEVLPVLQTSIDPPDHDPIWNSKPEWNEHNKSGRLIPLIMPDKEVIININNLNLRRKSYG